MAQSFLSTRYTLAMAVAMTMPMMAWMRIRKDTWRLSAEMAGAMLVPTVLLIAVCWVAHLPSTVFITGTHILMVPAMLGVMLYRWSDYTCEPGARTSLARGEPARTMTQEAGERLAYAQMTPQTLADTAVRLLGTEVSWPPIAVNGAQ